MKQYPQRRSSDERLAVLETKVDGLERSVFDLGRAITDHAEKAEKASDAILTAINDPDGNLQQSLTGMRARHHKLERRVYYVSALIAGAGLGGTKLGEWLIHLFKP